MMNTETNHFLDNDKPALPTIEAFFSTCANPAGLDYDNSKVSIYRYVPEMFDNPSYYEFFARVPQTGVDPALALFVKRFGKTPFKLELVPDTEKTYLPDKGYKDIAKVVTPRVKTTTDKKCKCSQCGHVRSLLIKYEANPLTALCSICDKNQN